jgi:hypothetical protein
MQCSALQLHWNGWRLLQTPIATMRRPWLDILCHLTVMCILVTERHRSPCHGSGWLVAGLSPWVTGFASRSFHVGFVVVRVALAHVFLRILRFSPVSIIPFHHGRPTGGCSSETQSHLINMNMNKCHRAYLVSYFRLVS